MSWSSLSRGVANVRGPEEAARFEKRRGFQKPQLGVPWRIWEVLEDSDRNKNSLTLAWVFLFFGEPTQRSGEVE